MKRTRPAATTTTIPQLTHLALSQVPSCTAQQSLFRNDDGEFPSGDGGESLDTPCACGGPYYACSVDSKLRNHRCLDTWERQPTKAADQEWLYTTDEETKRCETIGWCPAIAQGWLAGIDPHSSEHVVYIKARDYIAAEGDHPDDEYCDGRNDFSCFAAIRLPYGPSRPVMLHELSRAILLVTAQRAVAADDSAARFFDIIGRLRQRWEMGVGIVLSFVVCAKGVWPEGEPDWRAGMMACRNY